MNFHELNDKLNEGPIWDLKQESFVCPWSGWNDEQLPGLKDPKLAAAWNAIGPLSRAITQIGQDSKLTATWNNFMQAMFEKMGWKNPQQQQGQNQ